MLIVRSQKVILTFGTGDTVKTAAVTGFTNAGMMVPMSVSSRLHSDTSYVARSKFSAEVTAVDEVTVTRGGSGTAATVIVYIVQFGAGTTVQKLSYTATGTTLTATISSVDKNSSFVVGSWHTTDTSADLRFYYTNHAYQLNSDTELRIRTKASGHYHIGFAYVVTHSSLTVQHGTLSASFEASQAITAVNLNKSFLIWSDTTSEGTADDEANSSGYLQAADSILFSPGQTNGTHVYYWQVISDSDIVKVQRFQSIRTTDETGDFTLSAVDLTSTIANANHPVASNNSTETTLAHRESCRSTTYDITSTTNLAWHKDDNNGSAVVEVISFGAVPNNVPVITDIGDEDFGPAEPNIVITGTKFQSTQGIGKVELANGATYATATKVNQSIDSWSDTSIQFDLSRGALAGTSLFIFVSNSYSETSIAYPVTVQLPKNPDTTIDVTSSSADATFEIAPLDTEVNITSSSEDATFAYVLNPETVVDILSSSVDATFKSPYIYPESQVDIVSSSEDSSTEVVMLLQETTVDILSTSGSAGFLFEQDSTLVNLTFYSNEAFLRDSTEDFIAVIMDSTFPLLGQGKYNISDTILKIKGKAYAAGNLAYEVLNDGNIVDSGTVAVTTTTAEHSITLEPNYLTGSKSIEVRLVLATGYELFMLKIDYKSPKLPLESMYGQKQTVITSLDPRTLDPGSTELSLGRGTKYYGYTDMLLKYSISVNSASVDMEIFGARRSWRKPLNISSSLFIDGADHLINLPLNALAAVADGTALIEMDCSTWASLNKLEILGTASVNLVPLEVITPNIYLYEDLGTDPVSPVPWMGGVTNNIASGYDGIHKGAFTFFDRLNMYWNTRGGYIQTDGSVEDGYLEVLVSSWTTSYAEECCNSRGVRFNKVTHCLLNGTFVREANDALAVFEDSNFYSSGYAYVPFSVHLACKNEPGPAYTGLRGVSTNPVGTAFHSLYMLKHALWTRSYYARRVAKIL